MMTRFLRLFVIGFAMSALAACETPDPVQVLPEMTFEHLAPLKLNVARVEVSSDYASPLASPNVEHLFPTSPEAAMRRWVLDRLQAVGTGGVAKIVIRDASATEERLALKKGLEGAITTEQSERFRAAVEAMIEIYDDYGNHKGYASARAVHSKTLAEDATLNQREKLWFDLTEGLLHDFDAEMEKNIRRHLVGWLMM